MSGRYYGVSGRLAEVLVAGVLHTASADASPKY